MKISITFWCIVLWQYLLRISFSQIISSFSSSSLTYDSTTLNLLSYTHSQGLLGILSKNNLIYIQNLDHTLAEQGLSLLVGLLFARVVYVKPASTDPREYIFGFTSGGTIEGYSIPIIDSTNNHGSNLFFLDKYLYSIRYTSNPVIVSSQYYIGFDAFFDPSSSNLFSFFLCTTTNGLLYSTSLDLKTIVTFTVYTPATTAGVSTCSSISKIGELYFLLNSSYLCNVSTNICTNIGQAAANPSTNVIQNAIVRTNLFSYSTSNSAITTYSWLSNSDGSTSSIAYIFDYKNMGVNLLFIVQEATAVSLQIRSGTDDTQLIFKGYLSDLTTLTSMKVLYESSQELYVMSTLSSSTAAIQAYCIDSSYNSNTLTCTNTNILNCLFESQFKCIVCSLGYYPDPNSGLCVQCNSKCVNGCTSATVCNQCLGLYRNTADTCKCISPRIEPTRLLQFIHNQSQNIPNIIESNSSQNQLPAHPRQLTSPYDCVCPAKQILDANNKCATCMDVFGPSCEDCTQLACTQCRSNSYLSTGACVMCSSIHLECLTCDSSGCLSCGVGYFLNAQKSCTACSLTLVGCSACSSATVCTICNLNYYLNASLTCNKCFVDCVGGCLSEQVCNNCASLTMDPLHQCQCTGGRKKTSSTSCDCDSTSFWDANSQLCGECIGKYTIQCLNCSDTSCTTCTDNYYVSSALSGKCALCSDLFSNCLRCTQYKCTQCASGYYVNDQGTCTPCSSVCVGGCSSALICTNCSTTLRDPNNGCVCASNRIENPSTLLCECPSNAYEASPQTVSCPLCTTKYGTGCLSCTDSLCTQCSSLSYYYSPNNMKCGLCSADFGETCIDCTQAGCKTCSGGSTVNSLGICVCSSTQFYYVNPTTSVGICKDCSVAYVPSCKSCNSSTCLDCGDSHAIYKSATNECACIDSYYLGTILNQQVVCLSCADAFNTQCKLCSASGCTSCSNGYYVNSITKQCYCPDNSTIVSSTCQLCTSLYGSHCKTCNSTQCLSCDSVYRIPSSNCSCRTQNAVELNGQCLQCDLIQTNSSSLALTSTYSFSLDCNFSSDSTFTSTSVYNFYILKTFSAILSASTTNTPTSQTSKILISQSSSVSNIQLPHGTTAILGTYSNTNYPTLVFSIQTSFSVNSVYNNFSDIYTKYFSFKLNQTFSSSNAMLYLAESLEITQFLSDVSTKQPTICSTLSNDGNLCDCIDATKYFFDCSGTIAQYEGMQQVLLQYMKFMDSRDTVFTSLQKSIITFSQSFLEPLIDSAHLATHPTQITSLLNYLAFQLTLIDGSTYLPTDFQDQADSIASSLNEILTSSIASPANIQSALTMLTKLQDSTLLTIDPFYTQSSTKPAASVLVKSNDLKVEQKLFACSSGTANVTNITLSASQVSSSRQRLLQTTPNCQLISASSTINPAKYYFGLSLTATTFNPLINSTNFPYKDQDFTYFSAQLQPFKSSRMRNIRILQQQNEFSSTQTDSRDLAAATISTTSNDQFSISFPVVTSNPKNKTMTLDTNQLRCIYLNSTNSSDIKWSKCLSHSYVSASNTLSCRCPSKATYVFDYNFLFSDIDSTLDIISKQNQLTLIIVAIVLAVIFIVLVILYAAIYKPKQADYELAQLGKDKETNSMAMRSKLQSNLSQVKQSESQHLQARSPYFKSENEHIENNLNLNSHKHAVYNRSTFSPLLLANHNINLNNFNTQGNNTNYNEQLSNRQNYVGNQSNSAFQNILSDDHMQTFAHAAGFVEKHGNNKQSRNNIEELVDNRIINRQNEIDLRHIQREQSSNVNNNKNISKSNINHNHANLAHASHIKLDTFGGGNNSSFLNDKSQLSKFNSNVSVSEFDEGYTNQPAARNDVIESFVPEKDNKPQQKSSIQNPASIDINLNPQFNNNINTLPKNTGNGNNNQNDNQFVNIVQNDKWNPSENLDNPMNKPKLSLPKPTKVPYQQSGGADATSPVKIIDMEAPLGLFMNSLPHNEFENNLKTAKNTNKQSNNKPKSDSEHSEEEDQSYLDEQQSHNSNLNIPHSSGSNSIFSKRQIPVSLNLITSAQRIPAETTKNSNIKLSKPTDKNCTSEEDQQKNFDADSDQIIQLD